MKSYYALSLTLLLSVLVTSAYGADEIGTGFYFSDSVAGQEITIQGLFKDPGNRKVLFTKVSSAGATREVAAVVPESGDRLRFVIPTDLESGRYRVTVRLIGQGGAQSDLAVPGELRIPPPPGPKVSVSSVRPVSSYPNPAHGDKYDFEIAGTNFATDLASNHVEINGLPLNLKYDDACGKDYKDPCIRAEESSLTRKLIVEGYEPPGFSHPLEVAVRVGNGDNVAKAADPLIFSSISKTRLQIYAVGAFLALVGILFLLVRTGIKLRKVSDESFNSVRAFLIDKDTNSYSLSKFQLTLFTLVTVFGYIYVFVCHLFVQWKFELPPVPDGLPSMMAVSVGTSVVAAGIGARIGGKGAGAESPSLSDFITSGGVVLPERFQFFLWTIVSSMGVLVLILASDPVTVTQLPKLPDGMLYLMGLSSAGYLGGKLVRGPGPNIKSIDADRLPAQGAQPAVPGFTALVITLTGDNLSPSATYQLDDEKIPADQVTILAKTDDVQQPQFCSMLKVQLKDVAERYFEGPHVLRIVNPDAQGAEITYGTKITSAVRVEEQGAAMVKLSVKGSNFKDPSSGSWLQKGAAAQDIPSANVRKVSDTEIEVTLPQNAALPGKLTIKSPGGLSTTVDVA
jgi:hypothetical protein